MRQLIIVLLAWFMVPCLWSVEGGIDASQAFSVPSQSGFVAQFGLVEPGDVLKVDVSPDPDCEIDGAVVGGDPTWIGSGSFVATGTIPDNKAGRHDGAFKGSYSCDGDGEGEGSTPEWNGTAKAYTEALKCGDEGCASVISIWCEGEPANCESVTFKARMYYDPGTLLDCEDDSEKGEPQCEPTLTLTVTKLSDGETPSGICASSMPSAPSDCAEKYHDASKPYAFEGAGWYRITAEGELACLAPSCSGDKDTFDTSCGYAHLTEECFVFVSGVVKVEAGSKSSEGDSVQEKTLYMANNEYDKTNERSNVSTAVTATLAPEGAGPESDMEWTGDSISPRPPVASTFTQKDHGNWPISYGNSCTSAAMNIFLEGIDVSHPSVPAENEADTTNFYVRVFLNENFTKEKTTTEEDSHVGCLKIDHTEKEVDPKTDEMVELSLDWIKGDDEKAEARIDKQFEDYVNIYVNDEPYDGSFKNIDSYWSGATIMMEGHTGNQFDIIAEIKTQDSYTAKDILSVRVVPIDMDVLAPPKFESELTADEHEICDLASFVRHNDDDDDGDHIVDYEDPKVDGDDDDLATIILRVPADPAEEKDFDGEFTLDVPDGIALWETADKSKKAKASYPYKKLPLTLYVEGTAPNSEWMGSIVETSVKLVGGCMARDDVRFSVLKADLDIDSDNTRGIETPERDDAEDLIEDAEPEDQYPGKVVFVNDGDVDLDFVPNFADGFDRFNNQGPNAGGAFYPMVLEVQEPIDFADAKIRFLYNDSDPADVSRAGAGTFDDPYVYTPAAGRYRIWIKDGNESRQVKSVEDGGHFVPADKDISLDKLMEGESRTCTLFLEAIDTSVGIGMDRISISIDIDGESGHVEPHVFDAVRTTSLKATPRTVASGRLAIVEISGPILDIESMHMAYEQGSPAVGLERGSSDDTIPEQVDLGEYDAWGEKGADLPDWWVEPGKPNSVFYLLHVPQYASGWFTGTMDLVMKGKDRPDLTGITVNQLLGVLYLNSQADRNHDGSIDQVDGYAIHHAEADRDADHLVTDDDLPFVHQPDAVICSGFSTPDQYAQPDRIELKLNWDTWMDPNAPVQVRLELLNATDPSDSKANTWVRDRVTIYDAATDGDVIEAESLFAKTDLPESIWLEFKLDAVALVRLSLRADDPDWNLTANFRVARLSNGLASNDGMAPTQVVGGGAYGDLMSGNMHIGLLHDQFGTPLMGPDAYLSYNHQDGIETGLGYGWRSNFDERILDGAWNQTLDTEDRFGVNPSDRNDDDRLVYIDASGRRHVFTYDGERFVADGDSAVIGAWIETDGSLPERGPLDELEAPDREKAYTVYLRDNIVRHFDRRGLLMAKIDLKDDAIFVERGSGARDRLEVVRAFDEAEREVGLSANSLGDGGADPVYKLNRIETELSGTWRCFYEDDTDRLETWQITDGGEAKDEDPKWSFTYGDFADDNRLVSYKRPGEQDGFTIVRIPESMSEPPSRFTVTGPGGFEQRFQQLDVPRNLVGQQVKCAIGDSQSPDLVTDYVYATSQRLVTGISVGSAPITIIGYDAIGNRTSQQTGQGAESTWSWGDEGIDGANLLLSEEHGSQGARTYDYNDQGQVTKLTDAMGYITRFRYSNDHFLTTQQDPEHGQLQFSNHDTYGNPGRTTYQSTKRWMDMTYVDGGKRGWLKTSSDEDGLTTEYRYNHMGLTTMVIPPDGSENSRNQQFVYDVLGRETTRIDLAGRENVISRDARGRVTSVSQPGLLPITHDYAEDDNGVVVSTYRGAVGSGRLLSRTHYDPLGRSVSTTVLVQRLYDASGVAVGAPSDSVTKTIYDSAGRVVAMIDPVNGDDKPARIAYDGANRRSIVTTPGGAVTRYTYDEADRVEKVTGPDGEETRYTYNKNNQVKTVIDANGGTTTTTYDDNGRVASVVMPDGSERHYTYAADGMIDTIRDGYGNETTYEKNGQEWTITAPTKEGETAPTKVTTNSAGLIGSITQPGQREIAYDYDDDNFLLKSSQAGRGQMVRSDRHPSGMPRSIQRNAFRPSTTDFNAYADSTFIKQPATQGTENVITPHIDPATGQQVASADELTPQSGQNFNGALLEQDLLGQRLRWLDADGHEWSATYDADGRQETVTRPSGLVTTNAYSPGGRLLTVTERKGAHSRVTTHHYNQAGLRTRTEYPGGMVWSATYDHAGRQLTVTSAGRTTGYTYVRDRLKSVSRPDGTIENYTYDQVGLLTGKTIGVRSWRYTYDQYGRAETIELPGAQARPTERFFYDSFGNLARFVDRFTRDMTFIRDSWGQVTSIQSNYFGTLTFHWDDSGVVTGVTSDLYGSTTRKYDARMRITGASTESGAAIATDGTEKQTYYNGGGLASVEGLDGSTTAWERDAYGRLSKTTINGLPATLHYDAFDRVVRIELPNDVERRFEYDDADRVIAKQERVGNQILSSWSFTYDTSTGQLRALTGPDELAQIFAYDGNHRLSTVQSSGPEEFTASYAYDDFGNRTRVQRTWSKTNHVVRPVFDLIVRAGEWQRDMSVASATLEAGESATASFHWDADREAITTIRATLAPDPQAACGVWLHSGAGLSATHRRVLVSNTMDGWQLEAWSVDQVGEWQRTHAVPFDLSRLSDDDAPGDPAPIAECAIVIMREGGTLMTTAVVGTTAVAQLHVLDPNQWVHDAGIVATCEPDIGEVTAAVSTISFVSKRPNEDRRYDYDPFNDQLRGWEDPETQTAETYEYAEHGGGLSGYERTIDGKLVMARSMTYDDLDRLTTVLDEHGHKLLTITYHGMSRHPATITDSRGEMALNVVNGKIVSTVRDGETVRYARQGNDTLWRSSKDETETSLVGYQGDSGGWLADDGDVDSRAVYDADGNAFLRSGSGRRTSPEDGPGYRGLWQHGESGLVFMGARIYDPEIGRFLTQDPAKAGNNWYAYADGDPVNKWDPNGLRAVVARDAWNEYQDWYSANISIPNNQYEAFGWGFPRNGEGTYVSNGKWYSRYVELFMHADIEEMMPSFDADNPRPPTVNPMTMTLDVARLRLADLPQADLDFITMVTDPDRLFVFERGGWREATGEDAAPYNYHIDKVINDAVDGTLNAVANAGEYLEFLDALPPQMGGGIGRAGKAARLARISSIVGRYAKHLDRASDLFKLPMLNAAAGRLRNFDAHLFGGGFGGLLLEGPTLGKLNAVRGNKFERAVLRALGAEKGVNASSSILTRKTTIPDLPVGAIYGVTDIKDVRRLTMSKQLRAQLDIATTGDLPFSLIISPRTRTISAPLRDAVRATGGVLYEFNPKTGLFSTVTIEGNKVIR